MSIQLTGILEAKNVPRHEISQYLPVCTTSWAVSSAKQTKRVKFAARKSLPPKETFPGQNQKVGRSAAPSSPFGGRKGEESPDRAGHPAAESADGSNLIRP